MNLLHPKYLLVAGLAILAAFTLAGHPIIDPASVAGLGMLVVGNTTTMEEVLAVAKKGADTIEQWTTKQGERLDAIEAAIVKANRPGLGNDDSKAPAETWIDRKTGKLIPVLSKGETLADTKDAAAPSIGRVLRGMVLGGQAHDAAELADERKALGVSPDPSGGYTVSGSVAAQWVDLLRAQMVLTQAGVRTVPMPTGDMSIAKVTADPTISWRAENAAFSETGPTFGAVTLQSKTCACLVKLSIELAQDSPNIEEILQKTIVGAMAGAIDSAGLVGVTTDAAAAPSGIFNLTGRNKVLTIGAPTSWDFLIDGKYELLLDNVPQSAIGAFIAHPAVWKKLAKLKTGIASDNTPLSMPAEIATIPKLWTTAAPLTGGTTAKGVLGAWSDYLMGVRKEITIVPIREAFLGTNLQIAVVAYARVDFAATRAESFVTLEGITV